MAEAGAAPGFFDARHYTYLPTWAKGAVLAAATLLLLLAAVMIYRNLGRDEAGDDILFYLSLAQTGALALIFAVILLFSTRDANVRDLRRLADQFLSNYVADALQRVSVPALGIDSFQVRDLGSKDIYGRVLEMHSGTFACRLWVGHNVKRLAVIYCVPLDYRAAAADAGPGAAKAAEDAEAAAVEKVRRAFAHTFMGADDADYGVSFEKATVDGKPFMSIWASAKTSAELLYNPREKLYWAQDIAMMTESFLRSAHRAGISLADCPEPGPL